MALEDRINEIKLSIDEFTRRLKRWLEDSNGTSIMPEAVKTALSVANIACGGDIPECCRALATMAVPRVVEEMRRFTHMEQDAFTMIGGNPVPTPRFWATIKQLLKAREGAEAPMIDVLEPVMDLLAQGVSIDQIGRHIYGQRGEGPFMRRGVVDLSLIKRQAEYEKQMRETGSAKIDPVIPPDWVPPWCQQDVDKRRSALKQELEAIDRLEHPKQYEDPASVEELIREGAYIQQIEKVKHVSRDEVLATAKRIGVHAQDGPSYHGARQTMPELSDDEDDATATNDPDTAALKALVIEAWLKSDGTKGNAEIAEEIRQAGHEMKALTVGAIIQHHKRKLREQKGVTA